MALLTAQRVTAAVPAIPVQNKRRFTGRIANTVYSDALLAMLYDWPHQVYQRLGPRMGAATVREQFVV